MEQVTEAVKAEITEKRENRENRKPAVKWLIIGLIVSLAASGIFTACYGIFERRAESRRNEQYIEDPLETSNTITYLYQNCYLLYRDLYNKEHQTSLSYGELYMQSTEGNEWLNDDQKRAEMADGDTEDLTIPEGEDLEDYVAQGSFAVQTREYLEEHFNTLESSFGQLNNLYDYRIRDTKTGEILSNLADTDIVVAIDKVSGKTSMIAVPRDTMVDVDVFDKDGNFKKTKEMELCIAYAYGDGFGTSCKNVTKSISRILYNVPIDKYFALDLNGIQPINDSIGGVKVQSLYDLPDYGVKKGDTVHLTGDLTEAYVRTRDMDDLNASLNRTQRQVQYLNAFADKVRGSVTSDFSVITNLYNTASDYCTTDLTVSNVTYLGSLLLQKGITGFQSYTLEGEMKAVDNKEFKDYVYAGFYPDKDSLMQTVLDVFYTRIR